MNELSLTIFEKDGQLYGIGELGKPTSKHLCNCLDWWSFVRGDVRIYALAVTPRVTVEIARQFAVKLYEGQTQRINIHAVYASGIAPVFGRRNAAS